MRDPGLGIARPPAATGIRPWPALLDPASWERAAAVCRGVPIVIGGCGRSGTSLLLALLSGHPRIFAIPDETQLLCPGAYRGWPELAERRGDFAARRGPPAMFFRLLRYGIPPTAVRWCEKSPKNVLFFGSILRNFGGRARLIHIVRDGRDVVTSRHPAGKPGEYWVAPARWVADVSAGLAFRDRPQVLTLCYEDLVADCAGTLAGVCRFLGEEFVESMTRPALAATVRRHGAWFGEVRDVHAESVGKWRLPEHRERIAEFLSHPGAVELLRRLGYSV